MLPDAAVGSLADTASCIRLGLRTGGPRNSRDGARLVLDGQKFRYMGVVSQA